MPSKNLTLKQADVLVTIRNFQHLHGYMPSVTELAQALQRCRGTAFQHLQALEARGVLRRHAKKARALEILQVA